MTRAATGRSNRYTLVDPCRNCPFRLDVEPYLKAERARGIATSLRGGGEFPCHKTTVYVDGEDGTGTLVDKPGVSRFCAGALATLENERHPNQMMRIAESLGMYDPERLARARTLVSASLTDWVRRFFTVPTVVDVFNGVETVLEFEHCAVVADDCEDPAGFGGFGGAHANDEEPTCNPLTDECSSCNRVACTACRSDQWGEPGNQFCVNCEGNSPDDDEEQD